MTKLRKDQENLLLKCLKKHRPDLLWVINKEEQIINNEKLGNELRDAVGTGLIDRGFKRNYEPNKYGLDLEELIDTLGELTGL